MNKKSKIKKALHFLLRNPLEIVAYGFMKTATFLPDELYLKILFRLKMRERLDMNNPTTFNQKLQWLKVHDRKPEYPKMVDKYEAKKFVADIIGEEYIVPTLGIWDKFSDIDFDSLPDQFVLKTTDGSGGTNVVICKDKNTFDRRKAEKALTLSQRHNETFINFREWPYKDIKPRIIAEKYLVESNGGLKDYKFSCYNGVANDVMVCLDREIGDVKFYFFNRDWNLLRYNKRGIAASADFTLPKPENIEKMFDIAGKLSEGIPYLRVDLYNVDGRIYFGETTFFPDSGFDRNLLRETDKLFGSMIDLSLINKE